MAELSKTIQQLTTATDYDESDYVVISNSVSGFDRKIVKQDFVDSIGNPTIDGYTAISEAPDRYTLTPSTGDPTIQYYNGMKVSFVAYDDSAGAVQIKVTGLDYRDMFLFGSATTSTIVTDQYYEAVYIGDEFAGSFYQTNVQQDSLPTVTGYSSTSLLGDEITLTPANGIVLGQYYDNMVVEFKSPIDSLGLPKLKIGALAPKDFYKFGFVATEAPFIIGDHYRATYVAAENAFYQTNLEEATIYTNEYIAVGTVALDELSTTYQLTSAKGVLKDGYYPEMSIQFTPDIASKGLVFVDIDGLGNKVLDEGPEDVIANDLIAGQALMGIYDGATFIKYRYATTNPAAPPIDPDLPVPPENQVAITIGTSHPIKSIQEAINALVEEYGATGGNRLATIFLDTGAIPNTSSNAVYIGQKDLSWITIDTISVVTVSNYINASPFEGFIRYTGTGTGIDEGEFPTISGAYIIPNGVKMVRTTTGKYKLKNVTVQGQGTASTLVAGLKSNITTYDNVTWTGQGVPITGAGGGSLKIKNSSFDGFTGFSIPDTTRLNFTNTIFNGSINIRTASGTIANSTFSNLGGVGLRFTGTSDVTLTECRVAGAPAQMSLSAESGSLVWVDGGDYRNTSLGVEPQNIVANGDGTFIRLANAPQGGTSEVNLGKVLTI